MLPLGIAGPPNPTAKINTIGNIMDKITPNGSATNGGGFLASDSSIPNPKTPLALGASDLRSLASQSFSRADAEGGVLNSNITNAWLDKASDALPKSAKVRATLGETPVSKFIDSANENFRDSPMTLQEAQELDGALGDMMQNNVDPKTGILNADGNKLLGVQRALRDSIEDATEADITGGKAGFQSLQEGRDLWAASARANDIERILNRAAMTENPVTAIKTGFRTLASNPSRLRGFTVDERTAINHAAKTGVVTGVLKFAGSRLISSLTGAVGGAAGGGPIGAGIGAGIGAVAGTPLRAAADALQRARGNQVLNMISNRPAVQNALVNNKPTMPVK